MERNLLSDLQGENTFAFGVLYKEYFISVKRYILTNNGTSEDAEDIFQDTMIVLVEKLRRDNFQLTASIKTYILAISKNLWLKKLRANHNSVELSEIIDNRFVEEVNFSIQKEKSLSDKLQNYIHKLTRHCQGLIHKIFFRNEPIEQIQKEYGYATKHTAINQKHKCVEQIRRVKSTEKIF